MKNNCEARLILAAKCFTRQKSVQEYCSSEKLMREEILEIKSADDLNLNLIL